MKKVLGLDLGVGSIGWSVVAVSDDTNARQCEILGAGSRVVPLDTDETTGFTQDKGESKCHTRTMKRSARRNLDRFQQRRKMLGQLLAETGMTFDNDLLRIPPLELWQLRARAAEGDRLTPAQLGRVLYHINMRRGYRHAKEEENAGADKKSQSEFLAGISGRAKEAADAGQTPGQYFAERLKASAFTTPGGSVCCSYRVKEQTFPRQSYEDELRRILEAQRRHFPDILTDENITRIFDTIFYQRPLRSCKHLVSICEFEGREVTDANGRTHLVGPRVAPASSPLAQECRLWEAANNIVLVNSHNRRRKDSPVAELLFGTSSDARKLAYEYPLDNADRRRIVDFLNHNDKMSGTDLLKLLGLKKADGFAVPAQVSKGLKGNVTRMMLRKALAGWPGAEDLLRFDIEIAETGKFDEDSGMAVMRVTDSYLRQPLYQLWHTCYSVSDPDEFAKAIRGKFGIDDKEVIDRLFHLDFRGMGYAGKSAAMMSKIIPWLRDGFKYSEACEMAGYNHSSYVTAEENAARPLLDALPQIAKGELRQPVVEKILNQMVNVVNAAMERFGRMDEIHVELARELKHSKDERVRDTIRISRLEKERAGIAAKLVEKGLKATRTQIQKYRMLQEADFCCMYCGKPINDMEFLRGIEADREHIIPRSLFFDDSFSNKVCACRKCNADKGQMTAYDFMATQGDDVLNRYVSRVEALLAQKKISKTKHDRLLTPLDKIPQDFIERDLRLTQYISRKALDMLRLVSRDVMATSGSVTDFFRHAWGYDRILHSLNFERYDQAGLTEEVEVIHKGQTHIETRIAGWSKRLDHRHHAIDALTIALTTRGYIQRLSTLNARAGDDDGRNAAKENLSRWAERQPHPSTAEVMRAAASIAISFKAGKKVTVPGKRYVQKGRKRILAQDGLLVPRGALTQEYVYGMNTFITEPKPLKFLFEHPEAVLDERIRRAVKNRMAASGGDVRAAVKSCGRHPLRAEGLQQPVAEARCREQAPVIRVKLSSITAKNCHDIVDGAVRRVVEARYDEVGGSADKFVKSLAERPLFRDEAGRLTIRSVRIRKGLQPESITPVRFDSEGNVLGYGAFGSNHHIALYLTPDGGVEERVVPFAEAVRRRLAGLPVVVEDADAVWRQIEHLGCDIPESSLERLPSPGSRLFMSMQVNEMFILGLSDEELRDCVQSHDLPALTSHLYRVQKLSSWDYNFKRHVCTVADCTNEQMACGNYIRITSFKALERWKPVKVRVDILGNIIVPDLL